MPQETHVYKITGFSTREEKIKTHPHILPQIPHVCITQIYFASMPFKKFKTGILTEKGRMFTKKYLGSTVQCPGIYSTARYPLLLG